MLSWQNRPNKRLAIDKCMDMMPNAQSSLWFPGEDCACINSAIERGIINQQSKLQLVERDPIIANKIRKFCNQKKLKYNLHEGELHDLTLKQNLDFAFFDFNGNITKFIAVWLIEELVPRLNESATIWITNAYKWRYCDPFHLYENKFPKKYQKGYREIVDHQKFYDEEGHEDNHILIPQLFIRSIFSEFKFKALQPIKYQDTTASMLLYRLSNFRRQENSIFPPLYEVLDMSETEILSMKSSRTQSLRAKSHKPINYYLPSENEYILINKLVALNGDYDLIRGWRRSFTLFMQKQIQSGKKEADILRKLRSQLVKMGKDPNLLNVRAKKST